MYKYLNGEKYIFMQHKLSTSLLANHLGISRKELFQQLQEQGFIQREDQKWMLTEKGIQHGGCYQSSEKYGTYITWPKTFCVPTDEIQTEMQYEDDHQNIDLVVEKKKRCLATLMHWLFARPQPKDDDTLSTTQNNDAEPEQMLEEKVEKKESFREQFPAKHRTMDGHMVRSKAEALIDNWLYGADVVHAYEKKLPIAEHVYSDFYLPKGRVYIEYWGYEQDEKYLERKKTKIALYEKYDFALIQLVDHDVENLDDIMPSLLLKHGIHVC